MLDIDKMLRMIRASGLKHTFIAEKCGMTDHMLCDVLAGRRKIGVGELAAFCRLFGVTMESMLIERAG